MMLLDFPTEEVDDMIARGVHVKVMVGKFPEWFWVKVVRRDGYTVWGEIKNNLLYAEGIGLDHGDEIELTRSDLALSTITGVWTQDQLDSINRVHERYQGSDKNER